MHEYFARAAELQRGTIKDESRERREHYDQNEVRQAVVCTREDVVMLCSFANDLNVQLHRLRRVVFALLIVQVLAALSRLGG